MRLPEQNAVEGLLTLGLELAGNRNGKSDPDFVIAHNVGSPLLYAVLGALCGREFAAFNVACV
jgi:hypothetical protein